MMKILYVGWLNTDNLGDVALYRAIKPLFEPDQLVTDARNCAAVMIGGGTLLFRNACAEEAHAAALSSNRVFIFGTGVGDPEFNEITKLEPWKDVLDRAFYVGVRGFRSLQILKDHGFDGEAEVIGDPALLLQAPSIDRQPADRGVVINLCYARRSRLLGLDNDAVRSAAVEAATVLLKSGRPVTFVSFESRDDWFVEEAVSALGRFGNVAFVKGYRSLERTLDLFTRAQLVIGEKLHAIIFAAAVGTPFISLAYRPKCLDFCESIGFERMVIRTDRVAASGILERVQYLDDNYRNMRDRLHTSVAGYRSKLENAALRVRAQLQASVAAGAPAAAAGSSSAVP